MGKPTKSQALAAVGRGEAREIEHLVRGVEYPDGNIFWLLDHSEETMDRFVCTYDEQGVITNKKYESKATKEFKRFFGRVRSVGSAIERLIGKPFMRALLLNAGVDVSKIQAVLKILNHGTSEQRRRYIIRELGSSRANLVYDLVERARADGKIDEQEWKAILRGARGK